MSEDGIIREAERIIRRARRLTRTLYQLAYVALSDSPFANEALQLLTKFVENNIITNNQLNKILQDVERWKQRRYAEYSKDEVEKMIENIKRELKRNGDEE
jgi:hypothetical protein